MMALVKQISHLNSSEEGHSEVGWYLYAFLRDRDLPPMTGIDGGSPVVLIAEGEIAAAVSRVRLAEFGEEALRRNLEDMEWLEEKVRLHERIVERVLAQGAVLPMKFCTIFLDPERVRRLLRRNRTPLLGALDSFKDKEEWGVKGFSHRAILRASLLQNDPALLALSGEVSGNPPGHAFFLQKKLEAIASEKVSEREGVLARLALEAIRADVAELVRHPPLLPQAPGGEELALNLACLVTKVRGEAFLAGLERWNREHAGEGFRLLASGPWPPFHFTPELHDDGE